MCAAIVAGAQTPVLNPVPGDTQSGGPDYDFRIGVYEVTNAQFATFLNSALTNPADPRGAYLYHDTDSGDVYVHTDVAGTTGTGGSGPLVFDASVGGAITYQQVGQQYVVAVGMDGLPVVGVSWYGAVKYCNWLSLDSGLPESQRAYTEAPAYSLSGWHPVTVLEANWAVRDLTDSERQALVEGYLGFRLPMDRGSTGASPYNEWYKAAAWQETAGTNGVYGFGRNTITGADANYWNSGDPFDNGPSPAGYYDGTDHGGEFATNDTSNGYGLYDLSGNVWEWTQDQAVAADRRAVRGGSWNSGTSSLRCVTRADVAAGSVTPTTGFRVVQSLPETLWIAPADDLTVSGPYGGSYDGGVFSRDYTIRNLTADAVSVDVTPNRDWITVNGQAVLAGEPVAAFDQLVVTLAVDVDCARQDAILGPDSGTVEFANSVDPVVQTRQVHLTLTEPLSVEPAGDYSATGFYGGPFAPAQKDYTITNASAEPIDWSATVDAAWLDVNSSGSFVSGQLAATGQPGDNVEVTVALTAQAADLTPGSYAARLTLRDECTGQEFTRNVSLQVDAPMTVAPQAEIAFSGPLGGPFPPFADQYVLTNATSEPLSWEVEVEPGVTWLAAHGPAGTSGVVDPLDNVAVTVEPGAAASTLGLGDYQATVTFRDVGSGYEVTRTVTLTVTELDVTPTTDFESSGPVGGPFVPSQAGYVIHNHRPPESPEMTWRVGVDPGPEAWVRINGQTPPVEGSIIEPEGTAAITISIDAAAAPVEVGLARATVTFEDVHTGATAVRYVDLLVGEEDFATPMALVPADDAQPGGPSYDYRISRFEVTNAEFVVFLNNTINNRTNPRGQYMYHDVDSGDVYINDDLSGDGAVGTSGSGTVMFDASAGGAISYDGQAYVVDAQLEDRPVAGVSWYGAAKYCNWMTLAQGMSSSQRCYTEGPGGDPANWRPATIAKTDWQTRDLDAAERETLLALRGFRLPMDDGAGGASAYNEWYKAAAWLDDAGTNSVYGFGRGVLGGVDANYLDSGDPFDNGSTPVGFYDGWNQLAGGSPTNDTDNAYLLYDLCGNVQEWMQDWGTAAGTRAVRGGSMVNLSASTLLRNEVRGSADAVSVAAYTGFRVVQSVPDTVVPVLVMPVEPLVVTGYVGGPFTVDALTQGLTLDNANTDGAAEWIATLDQTWVEFNSGPVAGGVIPPNSGETLTFVLTDAAKSLAEPPEPSLAMARVFGEPSQPGGPDYGLWMGLYEVTNAQFAAFLNDAMNNPANERGQYLYFDTDSGDVYINTSQTGEQGTEGEALATRVFETAAGGRIALNGAAYGVEVGFEEHPVAGVSWFGAVKYCNWLSLAEGIPVHQLAYTEGPYAGNWHPVTISTLNWWGTEDTASHPAPVGGRDLSAAERDTLVQGYMGFRLPMDGGASSSDSFNEWYLAAAWNPDASTAGANSVYGFGRDALTGADANYGASGDPFDEGTTPVGFFDGRIYNSDGLPDEDQQSDPGDFQTADNGNAFGIHDLTGNVGEWVQDVGTGGASHAVRGGGWADSSSSSLLRADGRAVRAAGAADGAIGFRVVQSRRGYLATVTINELTTAVAIDRYVLIAPVEPVLVQPDADVTASGPPGGPFVLDVNTYMLTNRSASPMDWQVTVDAAWLDINTSGQSVSGQLAAAGSPGDVVEIDLAANTAAEALAPGSYSAVLTFSNVTSGHNETRGVALTVSDTIQLFPTDDWLPAGPFYAADVQIDPPVETTYQLQNLLAVPVDYQVTADRNWITLDDGLPVSGTLGAAGGPGDSVAVTVALNADANSLGVGEYGATITFSDTTFGDQIEAGVSLAIEDPLVVSYDSQAFPDGDLIASGAFGGPFAPPEIEYTLTNEASYAVDWEVAADITWVDVTGPSGAAGNLPPDGSTTVTVAFNTEADSLGPGRHTGTITVSDLQTGHDRVYDVVLDIDEGLMLTPAGDGELAAPVGGPVLPWCVVYRLTNLDSFAVSWSVRTEPPASWVRINGQASDGGALAAGQFADVGVSVDSTAAEIGVEGTYAATVWFEREGLLSDVRQLTLRVTQPKFALALSAVAGGEDQPGGPAHAFEMGLFEVTNAQFAAFLNDALANPDSERGGYLYHDLDTGDVYINNDPSGDGDVGTDGSGTFIFDASAGGVIRYEAGAYVATSGLEDHPVVGVTWYGALKFCNWLTIDQGLPRSHRCYTESTADDLGGWRPVTITAANWKTRDLNDSERQALSDGHPGYRLPMDDGADNGEPSSDAADAYNEWFKAAAWDPVAGVVRAYGFGRDTIAGADANFSNSGDPFDNGPTPAGYYDGTDHGGVYATSATDNAYGLYDLCGNVHEWMQDRYAIGTGGRAVRGGSFEDGVGWVGTEDRSSAAPSLAWRSIGLRVVRVLQQLGDGDGDGDIDVADFAVLDGCLTGPGGGLLNDTCGVVNLDADGDVDLRDFAAFQVMLDGV
ncbi:MAG TPA: SUMF1/EgtB/PvdO family nonheme iron enzyme [Phycisphaerae bacterium]|nr:SUMF1/EgtB/PvdO family nonheme iron enzyme [Phycisphaerae bacterium]